MIPCSTANLICALVGLDPRKRLIGLCSGALKALPRSLADFMRARVIGARRYDHTPCWSGVNTNVITFSKTHTAASWENTGTTRSSPPGGYSDKNTYHCVGLTASFDGKVTVTGVCETKDADGDKRLGCLSMERRLFIPSLQELENTTAWSRHARSNNWGHLRPSRKGRFRAAIIRPARTS